MKNADVLIDGVKGWAALQSRKMKAAVHGLTLRDKRSVQKRIAQQKRTDQSSLEKSVGFAVKYEFGQPVRVNFKFVRHGVFVERGRFGAGGKKGSRTRPAKPFIAPILDPAIDALADILADKYAEIGAAEIKFVVPGIISKRIKISNG